MTLNEFMQKLEGMKLKHGGAVKVLVDHNKLEGLEMVPAEEWSPAYVNIMSE